MRKPVTDVNVDFVKATIATGTTDSALVTAVALNRIVVHSAVITCAGTATTITFNSKPGGAGTALSHSFTLAINSTIALPWSPAGYFWSNTGEGLTATTSGGGSNVGVTVTYSVQP